MHMYIVNILIHKFLFAHIDNMTTRMTGSSGGVPATSIQEARLVLVPEATRAES